MKKDKTPRQKKGISVNSVALPVLIIVAVLHFMIIYLILDVNQSNSVLSDLMNQSGDYQLDATNLQGSMNTMSETCAQYVQLAGSAPASVIVEPLSTYARQLTSENRTSKVLERFREYNVSDEVLSDIEDAAAISDEMMEVQIHAISLVRSVYPFPEDKPELNAIPKVELTAEELAMPNEARIGRAKSLVLDRDYAQMRYQISQKIAHCNSTLQDEFDKACKVATDRVTMVKAFLWSSVILIILVLSFTFLMFYQLIVKPIRNYSKDIAENKSIGQIKAVAELSTLVNAHNVQWEQRNKLESFLRTAAETDSLTGLPNRYCMERDIIENESNGGSLGLLLFDVNYLKHTNDTQGHLVGDKLILKSAACIKECFSNEAGDNCYRIGGDEFVVLMRGCSEQDIIDKIELFDSTLKRENVSVSVGYAFEENIDGDSFKILMEKADRQMYEKKRLLHEAQKSESGADKEIIVGSDVKAAINTERKEIDERTSRFDYLTGLPSISYFFELVVSSRDNLLKQGGVPSLLYTDLSGMKYYNHKYGFADGDDLIRSFASLLSRIFQIENCCHISADHFAVFADSNGLEEKLNLLFKEWDEMNKTTRLPICVGIYPNWSRSTSIAVAYDRSKIACDALKGTYVSRFNYYDSELNEAYVKQQYVLENFDNAIENKWIKVYYQPIMRAVNRKVCNEEALARWIDPVKGFLSPADFIPQIESAGLIYKLDLYVLERVLEDIKTQKEAGMFVVPHSINLSRSDFDSCDIVEEIRKRVDESGVGRKNICIEITESVIGSDFDFIKEQIERFQSLGFPVWMDDFGSGYSSLDVLQSIKFDLIKFDMNFMRRLDESEDGRIILTELMKMATALGVDTVCEGVETEGQARFLQEIGCSKLQGFYYSKPTAFADIMEWHKQHLSDGYENPHDSAYFEAIGGVNLFDLGVISQDAEYSLRNAYSTLPMGIIEVRGDSTRFLRSNQSYRDFLMRFFGLDLSNLGTEFVKYDAAFMYNVVKTCCEQGVRSFYDERMPDGSIVHSFARRISKNESTDTYAIAIAVLSITPPNENANYGEIARALAADYYCIYIVDMNTDDYIEYSSPIGGQAMAVENHGKDFFESSVQQSYRVYEEDREAFYKIFNKEQIGKVLDEQGAFNAIYRLVDTGVPVWVSMKISRLQPSRDKIIIGVSIIDSQMKQMELSEGSAKE